MKSGLTAAAIQTQTQESGKTLQVTLEYLRESYL